MSKQKLIYGDLYNLLGGLYQTIYDLENKNFEPDDSLLHEYSKVILNHLNNEDNDQIITKNMLGYLNILDKEYLFKTSNDLVFQSACENGHFEIVKWIVANTPNIDYSNSDGITFAGSSNNLEMIKWLVDKYPSHNYSNNYEFVRRVFFSGNIDIVKWLTTTYPNNSYMKLNNFIFHQLCSKRLFRLAKWLVNTFPNMDNDIGSTFLWSVQHYHCIAVCILDTFPSIELRIDNDHVFRNKCKAEPCFEMVREILKECRQRGVSLIDRFER
jgi:hypothetical protein